MRFWRCHGTKLLGGASFVVSCAVATPHLIPMRWVPVAGFVNLILGGLTVKRGFSNTRNANAGH